MSNQFYAIMFEDNTYLACTISGNYFCSKINNNCIVTYDDAEEAKADLEDNTFLNEYGDITYVKDYLSKGKVVRINVNIEYKIEAL